MVNVHKDLAADNNPNGQLGATDRKKSATLNKKTWVHLKTSELFLGCLVSSVVSAVSVFAAAGSNGRFLATDFCCISAGSNHGNNETSSCRTDSCSVQPSPSPNAFPVVLCAQFHLCICVFLQRCSHRDIQNTTGNSNSMKRFVPSDVRRN